jgi:hypothetical protein
VGDIIIIPSKLARPASIGINNTLAIWNSFIYLLYLADVLVTSHFFLAIKRHETSLACQNHA